MEKMQKPLKGLTKLRTTVEKTLKGTKKIKMD